MEEIELVLELVREQMEKALKHTHNELTKIRAGKAMPNMLDGLTVDYYGSKTPVSQVASITTPDARSIVVKPWEKNMISEIERSIINSDLGLNPQNDGEVIRLNIPPLTGDRRRDLVKQAKGECENGKIGIRKARQEANDSLKQLQKDGASEDVVKTSEEKVQKITKEYTDKIDAAFTEKEKEITTV
ncbi:ribosome-recycling factor [Fulvitalea axinellae]|uniref:Ribosome-recycling factor n=1 Tax=Fulvitalea axinellae TaxID=1182444 RepID=A0AAU9CP96_9BACT|nr:ribosome-recycling factor [Fulvitalea axinellae]